jgi:ribosomal protein L7/L12
MFDPQKRFESARLLPSALPLAILGYLIAPADTDLQVLEGLACEITNILDEMMVASATATVELTAIGEKKIEVIKVVRELTGSGLKQAKDLVEGAPKLLKEHVPIADAKEIKRALEAIGARVTLC